MILLQTRYIKHAGFSLLLGISLFASGCVNDTGTKSVQINSTDTQLTRPEQIRVPGESYPQKTAPSGIATNTIPVLAEVQTPPSTHIDISGAISPTLPPFEVPGPAKKKNRGLGVPAESDTLPSPTLNPVSKNNELMSWTGNSGSFPSTTFDDNGAISGGFRFIPPDSHTTAGLNHVINVVNVAIAIHQKDGTLVSRSALKDFFFFGAGDPRNPTTFTFDPKVIYDQYTDRYLVMTLEQTSTTSRIYLAVSQTSDPTGGWYITMINSVTNIGGTDYWADYPGFAVDDQGIYITANLFPLAGGGFGGNRIWIIDKGLAGGFYAGLGTVVNVYDPTAGFIATTLQPAHMFGGSPFGATSGTFLVSFSGMSNGTDEFLQIINVADPLGAPVFTRQFVNIGNIDNLAMALPDAPQPGTATRIEVNDRRSLNAVWRSNNLWSTMSHLPNSGVNTNQTTATWARLNTSNLAAMSLVNLGEIGGEDIAPGAYTYFPSIAINENGDVVIGFSASSPTTFPGAYFVTHEESDAPSFISTSQTVAAGVASYVRTFGGTRNRWGDYSGAAVDPFDGCLWVYNEYADTQGTPISGENGRWATASARTCSCTTSSPALPASQWSMVSMACDTGKNTIADLLPTLNIADYGTTWAVYEKDAANDNIIFKNTTDTLAEGKGYWVYTDQTGITLNLEGMKNKGNDIPLFSIVNGQMNLVGYPHQATIPWSDVRIIDGASVLTLDQVDPDLGGGLGLACEQAGGADASCIMSRKMYQWNGAAYQTFDGVTPGMLGSLTAFSALWVESFKPGIALRFPGTLAIPNTQAPTQAITTADSSETASRPDANWKRRIRRNKSWFMRLIVESGDLSDPGNVLGASPGSRYGKDIHDLKELPPFGSQYLTILFKNKKFDTDGWGYTTDFRSPKKGKRGVWRFAVKASSDVTNATLRWEATPRYILKKAYLLDEETGRRIKIDPNGSFTFTITGGVHYFRLIIK